MIEATFLNVQRHFLWWLWCPMCCTYSAPRLRRSDVPTLYRMSVTHTDHRHSELKDEELISYQYYETPIQQRIPGGSN